MKEQEKEIKAQEGNAVIRVDAKSKSPRNPVVTSPRTADKGKKFKNQNLDLQVEAKLITGEKQAIEKQLDNLNSIGSPAAKGNAKKTHQVKLTGMKVAVKKGQKSSSPSVIKKGAPGGK